MVIMPLIILEDDEKIRNYLTALITGSGNFNLKASLATDGDVIKYFKKGMGHNVELALTDIQFFGRAFYLPPTLLRCVTNERNE